MSKHETELLGAYVLGVLEPGERETVRAHLDDCEHCRRDVEDLQEIEAALGEMPPEAVIEGPPEDGDLVLQRTLRRAREERNRADRQRRLLQVAAAAVTGAAVLGGGAVIGRLTAPDTPTAQPTPSVSLAPNSRVATTTDATTGATMTATVQPAVGWVRIRAEVTGIAAGEQCRLYVIAHDGSRRDAGSWLVSEKAAAGGSVVDGSALMAPEDVAAVAVETFAGRRLVTVPI